MDLVEALKVIKAECEKHPICDGCLMRNSIEEVCALDIFPSCWGKSDFPNLKGAEEL